MYNIEFALKGYQKALREIFTDDPELLITDPSGAAIQISALRVDVQRNRKIASLKLTKKLQEFSSYFIHAYAGRHTLRHVVKEAESKISRHKASRITLPDFISNPKYLYWKLPEGSLIFDDKYWLDKIARLNGFSKYIISKKHVLGTGNGTTLLCILEDPDNRSATKSIVLKNMMRPTRVKWSRRLHKLSSTIDRSRVDPLFKLGNEYKALRLIRSIGLHTPIIQSVVLDKIVLVTQFIEGNLISNILKQCLDKSNMQYAFGWINVAGQHFAKIHAYKCTLGNIKPSNLIVSNNRLYFTGVDDFGFYSGDPLQDIIYFIGHMLQNLSANTAVAEQVLDNFFKGYSKEQPSSVKKLVISGQYPSILYTNFNSSIAETIKEGMSKFVN
jgi:tRNA A-37 threonylcarbamoyl transferase component Bud32